ncbi:protein-disulfide reductase DsbD family protein [Ferruginibacter sp. SUN106]|uniref:protein-disulfide reductase DsbD family protein n=1 Tax=Ferruginibacter sp. SUN106 TaxID=2978348 RepID=UPI003D36D598
MILKFVSKYLKQLATLSLLLFLSAVLFAQNTGQLKWQLSSQKINDKEYSITAKGIVADGWRVYSNKTVIDGLEKAAINFTDSSIKKNGEAEVGGAEKNITDPVFNVKAVVVEKEVTLSQKIIFTSTIPANLKISLAYSFAKGNDQFFPEAGEKFDVAIEGGVAVSANDNRIKINSIDLKNPVANCGNTTAEESKGLWQIFLIGFLGGLIALLTPCVFPMIPLTVSFFTKKETNRKKGVFNALIYGGFIFLIYVLLSVPFYFLPKGNEEILNNISTNPWLNIAFFIIFIVFALSFFGLYEITLPSSIANRADAKSNTGTLVGIFFMALTLAVVSFSCTGPILGSLLVGALNGGAINLTAGLAGFGLALALPFAIFALFPQLLSSLPKSGGWLGEVKVVLGFIELAMAMKFLSNADLTQHWGVIKREVFIGTWVFCGLCVTLYLLNLPPFKRKYPVKSSKAKLIFTLLFAAITIYLIPGVTNTKYAKLSLVSGFPPPYCYSVYQQPFYCDEPLKDYNEALKLARERNKPIMIDFTGWNCVNCRKMEENVWPDEKVKKLMGEFILVSLYVDDRKKLPAFKQFTYTTTDGTKKDIVTVGDKWATFEVENFAHTSQPYYALISPDEKLLNTPEPYESSPAAYAAWLQCGLDAFAKMKK